MHLQRIVDAPVPAVAALLTLSSEALADARRLADDLRPGDGDLHARHLLGWFYWFRYVELLERNDRRYEQDRTLAIRYLAECFLADGGPFPEPALPFLADAAEPAARELLQRALVSDDRRLVPQAVRAWKNIVLHTPPEHPAPAGRFSSLGVVLQLLYRQTGEVADLDAAIRAGRRAVESRFADPRDPGGHRANLGAALMLRYKRTGDLANLDESVDVLREAVAMTAADAPDRADRLNNLGAALQERFERLELPADLDEAIEVGRQAVAGSREDHEAKAGRLDNLAIALQLRADRTAAIADTDAAVDLARQAVAATPGNHPDRAGRLSNLGAVLQSRFERTGALADLDAAIDAARQAVAAGHPEHARHLFNLGSSLMRRFERTDAVADLDATVDAARQAVDATPADSPARADMLALLATTLELRHDRSGNPEDLDAAIHLGAQAVDLSPAGHPATAGYLSNLGSALLKGFQRSKERAYLDAAIRAAGQAVDAAAADEHRRARMLSNLSAALRTRYELTTESVHLNEAVDAARQAVDATPADHPSRASYLFNLGQVLRHRAELTGAGREDAVAALVEAVEITAAEPSVRIRAAQLAGALAAESDPGYAADLLEAAVRLLPEVAPRRIHRGDQQHRLGGFTGLAGDAAALALAAPRAAAQGDPPAVRALRLLELGRAVLLGQALNTRGDLTELTKQHPALAARFLDLRDQLDTATVDLPSSGTDTTPQAYDRKELDRHRLAAEFAATVADIRTREGFATFLLPPDPRELIGQAGQGPVVVFNISRYRSDALILTTEGVDHLPLPDLTHDTVVGKINAFYRSLADTGDPDRTWRQRQDAQQALSATLEWLWAAAVEPVLHVLGIDSAPGPAAEWPRVWWVPGGLLGRLPLHAAGHHRSAGREHTGRTALDRVVSSYAPTVRALLHARRPAPAAPAGSVIVAMPTTPGAGPLPHAVSEAAIVHARLPRPSLLVENDGPGTTALPAADAPTRANVLAAMAGCSIAHFACHGVSDPTDPSRSRLLLHDHAAHPLTVGGLALIDLERADLAYLSACSTAISRNALLLDEAIHLTTAFQLVGFRHVIGTLWEVIDHHAPQVADSFYATLRTPGGTLDTGRAAHALHETVRALRDQLPRTPSLWASYLHVGA